jgi:hypothetical protein
VFRRRRIRCQKTDDRSQRTDKRGFRNLGINSEEYIQFLNYHFLQSAIQNPQSAIEFLTPDPPAAEHLKPKTDLYANSVLAQHPNAVGKNAL